MVLVLLAGKIPKDWDWEEGFLHGTYLLCLGRSSFLFYYLYFYNYLLPEKVKESKHWEDTVRVLGLTTPKFNPLKTDFSYNDHSSFQ